jgi:AcrR family transcriptional regulator
VQAKKKARARKQPTEPAASSDRPPRERILNGAFGAFMELGYNNTTMLEIATRARVSKRDLYANFADKGAILTACVETRARRMRLPLELPPPVDEAGLLEALTRFGVASLREGTRPGSVAVLRLAVAESNGEPARVFHATAMEANRTALVRFLAKAQETRLLRPGDSGPMAGLFLAILWGNTLTRLLLRVGEAPGEAETERRARDAARVLLRLFGPA